MDRKLKVLRTDNGMEFCSLEFNEFCSKLGISRHKIVRLTPQQNGMAERMNHTLLNKVRCLLAASDLGTSFWGEALATATHLINRSPSSVLGFKTPEEMWKDKKPVLSYLKPFGCLAMAHQNVGKLKSRTIKCIMLGYPEGVKGYRLLSLEDSGTKIIISRDCSFNEQDFPLLRFNSPSPKFVLERYRVSDLHFPEQTNINPSDDVPENSESGQNSDIDSVDTASVPELETHEPEPNLQDYQLVRDRGRRRIIPNRRYQTVNLVELSLHMASEISTPVPKTYSKAVSCESSKEWILAMDKEINSLLDNNTWVVTEKPVGKNPIECKWLYKIKDPEQPGDKRRYKARLVAKGYSQKPGIDYGELFTPVVKFKTIRIILALSAQFDFEIDQLDVKTAFLYGSLDETIYMSQPEDYIDKNFPDGACLLKRSLYGLKQSPRQWNKKFDNVVKSLGFVKSRYDSCLYFKGPLFTNRVFLLVYVDDILIAAKNRGEIDDVKGKLKSNFSMKDLGTVKRILGIKIDRDRSERLITLSQKFYAHKILE